MTLPAPTYDLVLLLDPQAEEDVRTKRLADTRAAITAGGELLRHDEWGERALSYPIERRATARYHLMQFHAGGAELLSGLDRTLRLADEVLRFRIIKLAPGVPSAPDMSAAPAAPRQGEGEAGQSAGEPAAQEQVEAAPESEAGTEDEAGTESSAEAGTDGEAGAGSAEAGTEGSAEPEQAPEAAVGEPS